MEKKISCVLISFLLVSSSILAQMQEIYYPKDFRYLYGMKGFSKELLSMHFKLYEGYVKSTNLLREKIEQLNQDNQNRTLEYGGLKRMYGWEFDGMRLHEYYFGNLGGKRPLSQKNEIYKLILRDFGTFQKWKSDFIATGMIRGIGWAVLYYDPTSQVLTNTWINEHDMGHLAGCEPLLVMDVFEHAYITEYGLDRFAYIEAFFENIDWDVVEKRLLGDNHYIRY